MDFISSLEKRYGGWAIPNLTIYLVAVQAIGALMLMFNYARMEDLVLVGGLVKLGQWTRLFSFLMVPRSLNPIWLIFSLYVFQLIGSSLEKEWGAFRYNLFILTGYLLTLLAAFLAPASIVGNSYFLGTVFLAFATLFPEMEFFLFLIIPVKVKWLAWLTAAIYLFTLITTHFTGERLCVLAAFATYLLFFGKNFLSMFHAKRRREKYHARQEKVAAAPLHTCAECGATDKSNPERDFRYCSTCGKCFCEKHIADHSH